MIHGFFILCLLLFCNAQFLNRNIVGVLPDSGKTLEQYQEERIKERYEIAD